MFHWKNGWKFGRVNDEGNVIICNDELKATPLVIDADSWCSIVASVSKSGETAETWQQVNELHKGGNKNDDQSKGSRASHRANGL